MWPLGLNPSRLVSCIPSLSASSKGWNCIVEVLIPLLIWLPRAIVEEAATTLEAVAVDVAALGMDRREAAVVDTAMEAYRLPLFASSVVRMATPS